ncbi:MAG: biotin--[acetyl-CoA-carboxylase] ligase [Pyrinomonadaceae bacterium]
MDFHLPSINYPPANASGSDQMNFTILRFDELYSTNTEALNQAKRGAEEGLCIVARRQTAGRGRHGREWISPKDAGIYCSLILRPKIETRFLPLVTLMTAIAVHDALEELFKIECDIKWVNDIHVRGKKICGILAEAVETSKGLAVVVGIGINLKSTNFSAEIAETATSVQAETERAPNAEEILQKLTAFLSYFTDIFYDADGAETIRREWTRRSSYSFGKAVRVKLENEIIFGTTRGIEENGALRIETENGEIKIVQAGDVEMLRTISK